MKWLLALLLLGGAAQAASLPAVEAPHFMVVSAQHLAADAGVEILREGGNAVDAAVAVGYAEAVVNPCCGNIGGGGFMTIHLADGTDHFINFREMAPAAASANMYLDADGKPRPGASINGYLAVGVPGTVAGLDLALRHYGHLTRAQAMAPAIRLARDGFVLLRGDTDILQARTAKLRAQANVAAIFLHPDGSPLQPGERLVQSDLARTLAAIARDGPDGFYRGPVPQAVAAAARAYGGILTAADFATYHAADIAPLRCKYRGYDFVTAPPPSSGGTTMCEILNILAPTDMHALGFRSAASVHLLVEAMRHAYFDRNTYLGDPDFVANPLDWLLSAGHAAAIRASTDPNHAGKTSALQPGVAPHERKQTTHFSVLDAAGNAVSTTFTINGFFGAGVIAGDSGFFLNNEMDDFTSRPGVANMMGLVQGAANAIAPGKRPLSSMAPTILLKDGKPMLVLGSPGGARIITITLEVALNMIDYGMDLQEAVDAPRLHHQGLPDVVFTEKRGLSPDTIAKLTAMGYKIVEQIPWGAVAAIGRGGFPRDPGAIPAGTDIARSGLMLPGLIYGANDSRRPAGKAEGN